MPLGINLILNADGSKAMAAIGGVQSAFNQLGNTVKGELTQKMKMIFSAAAIEQAVQRTGEWAQQLTQTAKAMGVTNEVLQTLNILANKTNTPKDAVISMFENIDKARQQALEGNVELTTSFQRLGVTLQDLQTATKSELFSKTAAGIPSNLGGSSDIMRKGVQQITGTPEAYIENIQAGLGGSTFGEYKQQMLDSKEILDENTVNELSKSWGELLNDLTSVANDLKPLAIILIALARTVINAVGGVISLFSGLWDIISGFLSGNIEKINKGAYQVVSLIYGFIVKGVISALAGLSKMLVDAFSGVIATLKKSLYNLFGKEYKEDNQKKEDKPGWLTDKANKAIRFFDEGFNDANKQVKRGAAVADTAAILYSGGTEGLAKIAQTGTSAVAKVSGKLGMTEFSRKMLNQSDRFGVVGNGMFTASGKLTKEGELAQQRLFFEKLKMEEKARLNLAEKTGDISLAEKSVANLNELEDAIGKIKTAQSRLKSMTMVKKGIAGAIGASGVIGGFTNFIDTEKSTKEKKPIIPGLGPSISAGSDGSSMVKIGGMFGSSFQTKLIFLNQEMVKFLSQISANTMGKVNAEKYTSPSVGNAGGL